jgi:hypothetical protein
MPDTVLVLRTCDANLRSYGNFQWPDSGPVEAPDWDPTPKCGGGLHGLVDGLGDWSLLDWSIDARALLVEVESGVVVSFDGKAKFPRGTVCVVGRLPELLCRVVCDPRKIVDLIKVCGGNGSQLAASGNDSQLAASGDGSQLAASGYGSQLAASGYASKLAASGYGSIVCCAAGGGIVSAGLRGAMSTGWWDGTRWRIAVAYVGEDGIEPNVAYRVEAGKWVKA